MRGLAFPSNVAFPRQSPNDFGSPYPNGDNIPIDPALVGPAIDPAILGESSVNILHVQSTEHTQLQHSLQPLQPYSPSRQYSQEPRQYSQGPQGDPFAPPPPTSYLPVPDVSSPQLKPVKKRRKPRREEECGFCQGNDSKNKAGESELMVTCDECGRSGHPSCMDLADVSDVVRSYAWKCVECKNCEICHEKSDDERILFCDFCDRGWHTFCLPSPLTESPPGRWHCPLCPPLPPEGQYIGPTGQEMHFEMHRENSVASTSQLPGYPSKIDPDTQEMVSLAQGLGLNEDILVPPKRIGSRPKWNKKDKARKPTEEDNEERQSPSQHIKRIRFRRSSPLASSLPRVRLRLPAQKGKGKEREEAEEPKKGIFDDILNPDDRSTAKTSVEASDKQRFEKSRLAAEEKLAPPPPLRPLTVPPALDEPPTPGPSSRPLRSSSTLQPLSIPNLTLAPSASPAPSTPTPFTKSGDSSAPVLRIRTIRFGQFDIQTWYDAPFPEEYANIPDGRMWICEFCLKYMKSRFGAVRHRMKCKARHPPGDEIYRDGSISIFEVDGRKNKIYCQNLCLLSKMFLDHKSLFYDVEPFLFYVMTEVDDVGARFVGYFSKEKRSPKDYNVSCIMTLPVRQRQGWGNLLIDFSYLLSKKEQRLGSPEKPLSGLGALGYKSYWTLALMRFLGTVPDKASLRLEDISTATSMTVEDVCTALAHNGMLYTRDVTPPPARPSPGQSIKIPKGRKNGVARRHLQRKLTKDDENPKVPFAIPTDYQISWDGDAVKQYLTKWENKGYLTLKPEKLKWSPFLLSRVKVGESEETPKTATTPRRPETQNDTEFMSFMPDSFVVKPPSVKDSSPVDTSALLALTLEGDTDDCPVSQMPASPNKATRSMDGTNRRHDDAPKRALRNSSTSRSTPSPLKITGDDNVTGPPPVAVRTRSRSSRSTKTSDDTIVEDVVMRPDEPRRSRRSHATVSTPDAGSKRDVPTLANSSPRKRRRVESSPETVIPPVKAVNGKGKRRSHSSRPLRKLSLVVDESDTEDHSTALTPIRSSTMEIWEDDEPEKEAALGEQVIVDDHDHRNSSPELKSEDSGTSLTSLTSGRSVVNEVADSPMEVNGVPSSPDIPRQQVEEPQFAPADDCVMQDIEAAKIISSLSVAFTYPLPDEGDDADADGEYEEDAEGEPDVEFLGTY